MREIALDTETTGLDPKSGHRVVEIGCTELHRHMPTGASFHKYINPERAMPDEAYRIHGLSDAFLADKPLFADIADEFLEFIGDDPLVIHNAKFDMAFINAELANLDRQSLPMTRTIDTVALARRRFPGAQVSLDALCRRFEIDLSARTHHGALLDAELLSDVYLELCGGRQPDLALAWQGRSDTRTPVERPSRPPRPHQATSAERDAHAAFLAGLKDPIWQR
ncbi:MAG: DNA polymerase III subunit epsilon [Alphaproteobacteria bacterium]